MLSIICIIIFIVLTSWLYGLLRKSNVEFHYPRERLPIIDCNAYEAIVIAMFATAWIGLSPVLSLRLATLELLCFIVLFKCRNKLPFSSPMLFYLIFLLWVVIGIFYSTSLNFGIRMLLKYLYPFAFAMMTAKVVRDHNVFMLSGQWSRYIGTLGIILIIIPFTSKIFSSIFWYIAAYITGLITIIMFSLALSYISTNKKKNVIWAIALCAPCIIVTFRTDIFGTAVAFAMFYLIKYRIKALPIIASIGILGLCVMFYVPDVKNKMFIDPDKVSMSDYLQGNIDETNVQTNMRKFMWESATKMFYDGHELIGSGTGRVQKFFYTEATDARRGGQLHNDFLVLRCDNGNIGLALFIIAYLLVFLHCLKIYYDYDDPYLKMCAIVAGSSLVGIFVTMFSDNTLSYSMVTLSAPWGLYGMALGMKYKIDNE